MKNLFSLDNPFIQFLSRVGDMILANFLFLVCSLPIVTIGASLTALHKINQDIAADEDTGLFKTFFRAFRQNFKQATICWLVILFFFLCMACNALIVATFFTGNTAMICNSLLIVAAVIVLAISAYLFPLLVRYENGLKQHIVNAAILALVKLPKTALMVFINCLPVLIAYISLSTFFSTLIFWLFIGFSFASYLCSNLLMPVFREMEGKEGPNVQLFK